MKAGLYSYAVCIKSVMRAAGIISVVFLCLAGSCGCRKKDPVKIGFVACLSGKLTDRGYSGRNAVLLAVEQCNARGGINGRKITLLIKNDLGDPETARKVVLELIDEGVTAIVGHMTSAMSVASLSLINTYETVMISPTSATNELYNKDDYFFRVYPDVSIVAAALACFAAHELHLTRAAVIYDLNNRAYTETASRVFCEEFKKQGGTIVDTLAVTSSPTVSFHEIIHNLAGKEPDCLVAYTNEMDTATICQQIRKIGKNIQVLSSDWAASAELIQYGGEAVEGTVLLHTIRNDSREPKFVQFRQDYFDTFGVYPGVRASHAYDAASILIRALRENDNPAELKQTLLSIKDFEGIQGKIQFDEYGDIIRTLYPARIKNKTFKYMDKYEHGYQPQK
ncbi:MAG: amino acid ABC transporter substrate-binding protein [Candidatus Auribacter fodinae]|jgi:branched-chain amino acid transport system substrate-binding protein|uniref:Amino acid ABC transporter substrate-binding protein n=1 Tax=Candidatus Auribacter fodinae TaxID=2093366 RepID=A0A3A4R596_9BACT|nr:MAG: amino acid ABC transporter substrate-binding protein [Candidatus Auribacter fodinae]